MVLFDVKKAFRSTGDALAMPACGLFYAGRVNPVQPKIAPPDAPQTAQHHVMDTQQCKSPPAQSTGGLSEYRWTARICNDQYEKVGSCSSRITSRFEGRYQEVTALQATPAHRV